MKCSLPEHIQSAFDAAVTDWTSGNKVERLWKHDAGLWTNSGEEKWMGWLDIPSQQLAQADRFETLAREVKAAGYKDSVLLGMGGSSLCPEVLSITFGQQSGFPKFHVLDSTDPAQVKAVADASTPIDALCIVASKSGSTLEPNIFKQYFFEQSGKAGKHFIAITDPGSKMQAVAEKDGFGHIFYGLASIGGRYSALSDFGIIPGAVMGLDIRLFLSNAAAMAEICKTADAAKNPGVSLGLALGTLGAHGHDKVTIIASPAIYDLGAWLEQLIAESTGKIGKALIPVDREPVASPDVYGADRVFVYVEYTPAPDQSQRAAIDALEKAGHPVIRIELGGTYELGAEFFRWEIATAVAGSVIGINPFDQPDVEASKIATRTLTDEFEAKGSLPPETPVLEADGLKFFTDEKNSAVIHGKTATEFLKSHLDRIQPGDYFALLAYIQMNGPHEEALQKIRLAVRNRKKVATCLGFGPRFLHSTGQAYKGGPDTGVVLQVTCDDAVDLPVPGQKYTFGIVKAAQARGDFQVLSDRGRRALRVHLPADVESGLNKLTNAIMEALS